MDLILLASLVGIENAYLVISYDIACQWSKNFTAKRLGGYPALFQSAILTLVYLSFVVPKFHLPAHKPKCHSPYSLNFRQGSARTDGKCPERGWSHMGPLAPSTSEMGPGARHDVLDFHWSMFNFSKILELRECFSLSSLYLFLKCQ